ncbi:MAG TPA: cation:proton antiporter [Aurantimonas sp.]|jgi:multicomponent Na+:H+ antiporter subunit F|nr:cation:proton antiporter [Aurantimonas sp.]
MSLNEFAVAFFELALTGALILLCIAFLLTVIRILLGPTLPDRVLALDVLTNVAIGFIAVIALDSGYTLYVDVAIGLSLVGFLATVAFARFILSRGKSEHVSQDRPQPTQPEAVPHSEGRPT